MWCLGTPGTFWRHCSQSCVYSDETTWHPRWKMPLENPWKCHFCDSKFQNIPSFLDPQELVPLVRVPKPPAIHYQPSQCYLKTFWQPWLTCLFILVYQRMLFFLLFCFWLMLCFLSDQNFSGDRCDTLNRLQALKCQNLSNPSSKATPTQVLTCC